MKIGVCVPVGFGMGPETLDELGPRLDEKGIESVWVTEHVVMFDEYTSPYPYSPDGTMPAPSTAGLLDPFVALSYLAATTRTVRLGTGICIVPQRNPVVTAKQVADLDVLSRGRVDFGIGIGWSKEEYTALGVPWEKRGARTDEYLAVMRALWQDEHSSYEGDFYSLPTSRMYPKPVQAPRLPVHVGGGSHAALRRTARHGDGWYGMNLTPGDTAVALSQLDELLLAEGRKRSDVTISVSPPMGTLTPELVRQFGDLGVDRVIEQVFMTGATDIGVALDDVLTRTT